MYRITSAVDARLIAFAELFGDYESEAREQVFKIGRRRRKMLSVVPKYLLNQRQRDIGDEEEPAHKESVISPGRAKVRTVYTAKLVA